jgi:hypothetical protein
MVLELRIGLDSQLSQEHSVGSLPLEFSRQKLRLRIGGYYSLSRYVLRTPCMSLLMTY